MNDNDGILDDITRIEQEILEESNRSQVSFMKNESSEARIKINERIKALQVELEKLKGRLKG